MSALANTKSDELKRLLIDEIEEQVDRVGSIGAVAIRADFVGEHLADRRAADRHLDVVVRRFVAAIDDRLHVRHRGGEQRAHADDVRLELIGRGLELLHALVDADVLHDEAGALGHHANEVLADIVKVAAYGAHEQPAGRVGVFAAAGGE